MPPTWGDLFERAGAYDVDREQIRARADEQSTEDVADTPEESDG